MTVRRACLAGYLLLLLVSHGIRATRPEPPPPPGAARLAAVAGETLATDEVAVAFRDLRPTSKPRLRSSSSSTAAPAGSTTWTR